MQDLLGPATRGSPPTRITLHVPIITDHSVFSKFLGINECFYFQSVKYWDCLSESERVSDSGGKTTACRMNQGGWKDRQHQSACRCHCVWSRHPERDRGSRISSFTGMTPETWPSNSKLLSRRGMKDRSPWPIGLSRCAALSHPSKAASSIRQLRERIDR